MDEAIDEGSGHDLTARETLRGQRALLDGHDGAERRPRGRRGDAPIQHQRRIAPAGEWLQQKPLLAVEPDARPLVGGPVHPHIRQWLEPELPLMIEIGVVEKPAAVEEQRGVTRL
jgi:hypothetical protein